MVSAVLQGPPCPEVRAHVVFFRGIHLPHRSCPIQARYISDSSALRCDTLNHLFENVGAVGLEPTNPSLVRRNRTVARRRSLSLVVPASCTDRRPASPAVCLRWLPIWLPEFG